MGRIEKNETYRTLLGRTETCITSLHGRLIIQGHGLSKSQNTDIRVLTISPKFMCVQLCLPISVHLKEENPYFYEIL